MKKRDYKWVKVGNEFKQVPIDENKQQVKTEIEPTKEKKLGIKPAKFNPMPKNDNSAGIYTIICEQSKSVYIGQSMSVETRLRSHKSCLLNNVRNKVYDRMRKDLASYGIEAFTFARFCYCPPVAGTLLKTEEETMKEFFNNGYTLYNSGLSSALKDTIMSEHIKCPVKYQSLILEIINRFQYDTDYVNKLTEENKMQFVK